jgi:hypothetical protein
MSKEPIFIVGLPRTGSTLWHNVFAKKDNICRMGEMHYLTPVRKDFRYFLQHSVGPLSDDANVRKMVDLLFAGRPLGGIAEGFFTLELLKIDDPGFKEVLVRKILASDRSLERIFKTILEEYTQLMQKEQCCVKFPVYPNQIPTLAKWYPESKFVHIIRDPRAMAVSRKNDPGGTRKKIQKHPHLAFLIRLIMVGFVIAQYNWTSWLHRRYKRRYPNYRLFRYEDLLAHPETTIGDLCTFTDIAFSTEMLNPGKGQASSITDKKTEGFDRSAAFRWKQHIGKLEYVFITMSTWLAMRRLGYRPGRYMKKS